MLISAGQMSQALPLIPVPRASEIPLSFAQQCLWFLEQWQQASATYNVYEALHIRGTLAADKLEQSLNALVARHESLRTGFTSSENEPVQIIAAQALLLLQVIDLGELPSHERMAEAQRLANEEARRPFDLARSPLLHAILLRLDETDHMLVLNMHHIISDGWSMTLLIEELATLYKSLCNGHAAPLPVLPVQYADYTLWQRQWLQGEVLASQLAYWKQQLAGAPAILELPTDRPRPEVRTSSGARCSLLLPQALADVLGAVSRREGATLFMTLLAAFQILLHRYTGQQDILVGTPVAGRTHAVTEKVIGLFVNTLILRADLSGDPTFKEMLGRVREAALGAYMHQDLPFEKLVEELRPARELSRTPLFQVMFVLQNVPLPELDLPELSITPVAIDSGTAKFELTLLMTEMADGLEAVLEYNTDLFDAATITRMLGHLQTLLEGIAADAEQRISGLPLLTAPEHRQLTTEWNATQADYSQDICLHELFEAQVERAPAAIALEFEGLALTYGELNHRANQLAHHLRSLGVGPEVLVGLCLERSLAMLIGVLGILKAGGAYVPVDPSYPAARIAFLLEDAKVAVLVTEQSLRTRLPASATRVVSLDADRQTLDARPAENPHSGAKSEHPAYVIYTSGSTGTPKGVVVTHANVARLLAATQDWFRFDSTDVWTLFHSYAFDFSVWEIWGALLYGGRLVVVPYAVSRDPEAFYTLLHTGRVTVLNQTPQAFRQLMHAEERAGMKPLALRYVIFGGEALELNSLKPWFDRHGDSAPQLINMYGITETTVHVTYRPLTLADVTANSGSVIGQAIPDLQVYILDAHRQPVPIGVTGELHVGGAGLARGYLNRPELTAERFIPHPFSDDPHARLYKSGDLARYLPSGDIEYLGRIDHQVKIRGFRIELGEIEAVLVQHPAVREAVVIMRADSHGDKRLLGYVVARNDVTPGSLELRNFLKQRLPEHMVPAVFVVVPGLPLTAHGKVDQSALPLPESAMQAASGTDYVAPASGLEQAIAVIWQDAFQRDKVGRHDNFFDLGGHSLLMVSVHAQLREKVEAQISIIKLFQYPTISSLAKYLSQEAGATMSPGKLEDRVKKQKQAIINRQRRFKEMKL